MTGGIIGAISLLVVNYLVVRFLYDHRKLEQLVEGQADVLIENGKIHLGHLKKELITLEMLASAARKQGFDSLSEVAKVRAGAGWDAVFYREEAGDGGFTAPRDFGAFGSDAEGVGFVEGDAGGGDGLAECAQTAIVNRRRFTVDCGSVCGSPGPPLRSPRARKRGGRSGLLRLPAAGRVDDEREKGSRYG